MEPGQGHFYPDDVDNAVRSMALGLLSRPTHTIGLPTCLGFRASRAATRDRLAHCERTPSRQGG